jgi:C4-dicarboxylate-specific signal transduction histidine kinase
MKFRLIFLALGFLAFAATITGGIVYFQTVSTLVHDQARKSAQDSIEHLDKGISSMLKTDQKAVEVLAEMWSVQNFFNKPSPDTLAEVKFALDDFREAYNATRCCLIDRNGLVIAASAGEKSPAQTGDDYSNRPFFKKSLTGEPSTTLTQRITSKEPAINLSHPVFSENAVMGVALITVPLANIGEIFAHSNGLIALTDEHKLVFATNKPEWSFTILGTATAEELADIAENKLLAGKVPTQLPVAFNQDKGTANFPDGGRYLFSTSPLSSSPNWQINYFLEYGQIDTQLYRTLFGKTGALLAGMTLFVFGAIAYLFRQADVFLRQREAALAKARKFAEELALAHDTLKQSQAQILQQEKMASVGQLAAGVAHEINNPVGFISSNLSSLTKYLERLTLFIQALEAKLSQDAPDAELAVLRKKLKIDYILEDAQHLVEESLDGAGRVKKIVQGLKNFSRVDQAERLAADINECLDSTINIVWNELKYKCEVKKDYGELPQTVCNPQQLNQMFMNLLVNAAQAIETKGEIKIKTWADQDWIYTRISDTGCGIPQDKIKRIFEPFYTSKAVGKGTGLGLSIVYDIVVKNHQGDIQVESVEGKGTAFTVKIPVIATSPPGQ